MFVFCKEVKVYNYENHYHGRNQKTYNRIQLNSAKGRLNATQGQLNKSRGIKLAKTLVSQIQKQCITTRIQPLKSAQKLNATKNKRISSMQMRRQHSENKHRQGNNGQRLIKTHRTCERYVQTQLPIQDMKRQIKTPIKTSHYQTLSNTLQITKKANPYNLYPPFELDKSLYQNGQMRNEAPKVYQNPYHGQYKITQTELLNISVNNYKPPNYSWNRLKHRITDTDLKTIVSNQNIQQQSSLFNMPSEYQYVIEQSIIQVPNITNNFIQLNQKMQYNGYSQLLAIQKTSNIVVSLKIIPTHSSQTISRELTNYNTIPQHSCILQFYQHSMNQDDHILIKQPYTSRMRDVIKMVDIVVVLCDIESALIHLQRNNRYVDWVEVDDIVEVHGVFKFTNLNKIYSERRVKLAQNMERIRKQLIKCQI